MADINPDMYKNILPYIKLTSDEIIRQISLQKLEFSQIKDNFVEWKLNLPIFVRPFYAYVYKNGKIPTQDEFFEFYCDKNAEYFSAHNFNKGIMDGIKARIFMVMPSLVRDLHFNKYTAENIPGYNVLYNIELDIEHDIDLLLYNRKHIYGINLYTNTKRAHSWRKAKEKRHKLFDNVTYIELPVDFNCSHKVGDYFLYRKQEYNKILETIEL